MASIRRRAAEHRSKLSRWNFSSMPSEYQNQRPSPSFVAISIALFIVSHPNHSFSFNDASGHPLDSFPYFYRPISFSSLLRKMFWNNYIRNFVDLFVRKTVNRFNFVHSILPYLQIFLPLICLNKQTFIFRFESVQRQFVTITANFARFR